MSVLYWIALTLSVGLFASLLYAMFKPENF
jgi:K+-transporting ATPase KdpF subunit